MDTISIQQKGNCLTLATGNADEKEVINCVLPLFDGDDSDSGPLLQSKLYHILMTFNVMKNVDTCFESAYAAVICFLYKSLALGLRTSIPNLLTLKFVAR